MANAIKKISVQRGYDVTEYALNCFGSAGGQHACQIADTLGMSRVLIHPLSGLLSGYGMGLADLRASREQSIEAELNADTMRRVESLGFDMVCRGQPTKSRIRVSATTTSRRRHGCICDMTEPTLRCRSSSTNRS